MDLPRHCDVLVVGAGPAGSMAARTAARKGVSVLILERRLRVGRPIRCAEYVPLPVSRWVNLLDPEILVQSVRGLRTYIRGGALRETPTPGAMIRRDRLDAELARQALQAGAELQTGIQVYQKHGVEVLACRAGQWFSLRPQVIVGADGPGSQVGRWLGNAIGPFLFAVQVRLALKEPLDQARVYFDPRIPGGYGWVFPKGEQANLGVGIDPALSRNVRLILNQFQEERVAERLVRGPILGAAAGLVPVGGLKRVWEGPLVLAGDAAGTCHPISGAGVGNALTSGEMAGEAAAEAVIQGHYGPLERYQKDLVALLGPSLHRAVRRREELVSNWDCAEFEALIQKNWIAYKEYYNE